LLDLVMRIMLYPGYSYLFYQHRFLPTRAFQHTLNRLVHDTMVGAFAKDEFERR
jgi:hypothetical protein